MPWREAGITSQRLEFVTLAMAEGEEAGVLSGSFCLSGHWFETSEIFGTSGARLS